MFSVSKLNKQGDNIQPYHIPSPKYGKFLSGWEYKTTLPASWENCMHLKKQQLETDMEQSIGSKLGKEYVKASYCHSGLLKFYTEYIMRNAGLDEAQAGIKIARRNINTLRYADDTIHSM